MTGALGLLRLFCIFFYLGLFAVGGGLVAAAFMKQILVERYGLLSIEKFYSMLAISESTPGPIGVNLATFCGAELYGPVGGIVTTLGEVLPSLIVIMLVARFFSGIQRRPLVQAAFSGVRPATSGLVLVAALGSILVSLFDVALFKDTGSVADLFLWRQIVFYALSLAVLSVFRKIHPVVLVAAGAVFGLLFL